MKKPTNDIKTVGYVLRRTNYGEADRILNLITPRGKLAVLAKGTRRAKSKLAGGVEMLTRSQLMVHLGLKGMGTLTGARMERHYGNIIKDLSRMECASAMLRRINAVAEDYVGQEKAASGNDSVDEGGGYFDILDESLMALDRGVNVMLAEAWFLINTARVSGEEMNLYRDVTGKKLEASERYVWDNAEKAFLCYAGGEFGAEEIKLMRLMVSARLAVVARVKGVEEKWPNILQTVRSVVK